jgi:hypothetical protein
VTSWIADPDNQEALYAICRQAVGELAPEEEPILSELFPRYVELAQEGEVTIGAETSEAFGFAGDSDLVTLIIIPVLFQIVSALLIKHSLARIAELKRANREESEQIVNQEEIGRQVEKGLGSTVRNPSLRRQVGRSAANALMGYVEGE